VVNKADGDNLERAKVTQGEYERMVEFIRPATEGWQKMFFNHTVHPGKSLTLAPVLKDTRFFCDFLKLAHNCPNDHQEPYAGSPCGGIDRRRVTQPGSYGTHPYL